MLTDRARTLLTTAVDASATPNMVGQASQDFIDASRDADPKDISTALRILVDGYSLPYTDHLPLALATAGAVVERGADATPLVAPVVEFLQRVTPLAVDFHHAVRRPRSLTAKKAYESWAARMNQLPARLRSLRECVQCRLIEVLRTTTPLRSCRAASRVNHADLVEIRLNFETN